MRTATGNAPTRLSIAALALSLLAPSLVEAAPAVDVVPTRVTDERSTEDFIASLKVEAQLVGGMMADAKGVHVQIATAVDDTGRSLVEPQRQGAAARFEEPSGTYPEIKMELANPARTARVVKITGTVDVFVPKRDPAARITVDSVLQHTGTPLQSEALRATGIQMVVLNRDEYVAYKKKQEAAEKAADKKGGEKDLGTALVADLGKAFIEMFGASDDMGPDDIALTFSDPESRLVSAGFEDAAGKVIDPDSRMRTGGSQTFSFTKPLPATARLRLFVLTPASVIKVPFSLSDLALP